MSRGSADASSLGAQRVRIPADVERPDRILAGLTARQVAILAGFALVLYAGYTLTRALLPPVVFAIAAFPLAAAGGALVLASYDGLSADRLAAAALRFARTPRRQVPVDGPVPAGPGWQDWPAAPAPAPLALPGAGVDDDGVIDLGGQGSALVCTCSSLNFALRTAAEQQALIGAFAGFLNALSAPVQVVVRTDRIDLTGVVAALETAAGGLPHPGLEAAARSHAGFLAELAGRSDLLSRQLLLVLREPAQPARAARRAGGRQAAQQAGGSGQLRRRAEHARAALAAAGVTVEILNGPAATAVLAAAANPGGPARPAGLAAPGAVITAAQPTWQEASACFTD